MPRVYGLLKSASTGQLGRRQGRQSPFGVGYNPCYIPYRNSLLTMVLQDSLGESTDHEGFLQLSVCYPFTPTSRQTQNSTQFSCFILLKMVKRIKNLKVLPKRFQLNLDERLERQNVMVIFIPPKFFIFSDFLAESLVIRKLQGSQLTFSTISARKKAPENFW